MKKWLNPITLSLGHISLEPLSLSHLEGLKQAVSDGELWRLWYTSAPEPEQVETYIVKALQEFEAGLSLPFAVIDKQCNQVIGTTRYMRADATNRRLEIGTTWYAQSAQGSGVNTICKYLLLEHAFEQLDCIAVEFRTHWHNRQSRKAISKLGAKQDGILRNHQFDKSGNLRDTVVYSIIEGEWKSVKQSLMFEMKEKR